MILLELDKPLLAVEPLAISHAAGAPRTWESLCEGNVVQGEPSATPSAWHFALPAGASPSFSGAPLMSDGQVVGIVPKYALTQTTIPAVRARAVQDLLEEMFQVVKIGEVRLPSSDNPAVARLRDRNQRGTREVAIPVVFDSRFQQQPQVIVSLQKLDVQDGTAAHIHRLWVFATNVTPDGFDLVFQTWAESIVYDAIAVWTAVGEAPNTFVDRGRRADPS